MESSPSNKENAFQKKSFKYFGKYGLDLNERGLKEQKIHNRDIVSSHFKGYMNKSNGMKLKSEFLAIQSAKRIQRLNIDVFLDYDIADQEFSEINKILKRQKSVRNVCVKIMSLSRIKNQHLKDFGQGLKNLANLHTTNLKLRSSLMTGDGIQKFAKDLKKLCSLRNIDLEIDSFYITDKELQKLGKTLSRLPSLQKANILLPKGEQITDQGLQQLSQGLNKRSCLRNFNISFISHQVTGQGLEYLAEGLKRLDSLKNIGLSYQL